MSSAHAVRVIAHYLPQYHAIAENDRWWEPGFTEWTHVQRARPLFDGHAQPRQPGELGHYSLLAPATRARQAQLAQLHGIEGFCYWHYWFASRQLLERPFAEVLRSGEPRFPFCLAWANESWSDHRRAGASRTLIEQTYPPGDADAHFAALLEAFRDARYIRVHDKPLFLVYQPLQLPNASDFTQRWRELARRAGLAGLWLVGIAHDPWNPLEHGFDAYASTDAFPSVLVRGMRPLPAAQPVLAFAYEEFAREYARVTPAAAQPWRYPSIVPNWDNTPRYGPHGQLLHESTPELFRTVIRAGLAQCPSEPEERILFVKSWNEWAEGNYLEPDAVHGLGYLEALRDELRAFRAS